METTPPRGDASGPPLTPAQVRDLRSAIASFPRTPVRNTNPSPSRLTPHTPLRPFRATSNPPVSADNRIVDFDPAVFVPPPVAAAAQGPFVQDITWGALIPGVVPLTTLVPEFATEVDYRSYRMRLTSMVSNQPEVNRGYANKTVEHAQFDAPLGHV